MKRIIILLFCAIGTSMFSYSQADLAVTDINVSSDVNNWVPLGMKTTVEVTIQNVDSIAVVSGDSIMIGIQSGSFYHSDWIMLTNGLDTGETFTHNFGANNRLNFDASMDTASLIGSLAHPLDSALTNNHYTEVFYASTIVNNDWHAGIIEIIAPNNLNFFDVDNGTNVPPPLSEVEINLMNTGTVTYLEGSLIEYEVYLENETIALSGNIEGGSVGNGGQSTRTVSNQAVLPSIPDSAGTYQLCARTRVPNDLTPNNDAACMIFKLVDNFDPTDPINWPFGVASTSALEASIFMNGKTLEVESNEPYKAEIIDLSGKVIYQNSLVGKASVSMHGFSSGIYFVRLSNDAKEPMTEKVLLR